MKTNLCGKLILILAIWTGQALVATAQTTPPKMALQLQPNRLKGGHFLHKNLAFGDYKTQRFRRTLGSFFAARPLQPLNSIMRVGGIPLYNHKLRWSKDVFRFELLRSGIVISTVESRATLLTDETFSLFRLAQDSSFFGERNIDLLEARIQLAKQPNDFWDVVATNLNGTKREAQKGLIRKDSITIEFIRTLALLRERRVEPGNHKTLLSNLYQAYAFSYGQEVVAAVTVDEKGRHKRVWFKEGLTPTLADVIASTVTILMARRTIYK